MGVWRKRWSGHPDRELVEVAESFLRGALPDRAGGRAKRLPAWAWVSALAHGSRATVEELACRQGERDTAAGWARAVGFLAGEALDVAGPGEDGLAELQRRVLVPAELDFLDRAAQEGTPEPERFVAGVLPALEEERRARPAR
jgi:hypothetical protein